MSHDVPPPLDRLATAQHVVALTLDAGGNADGAHQAFAELRRAAIPVTFFLTGQFFWTYMVNKAKSTIGGLDLPTLTKPLNQSPPIAYRDDIHRWEMLATNSLRTSLSPSL